MTAALLTTIVGINSCVTASQRAHLEGEIARSVELERFSRQEARQAVARGDRQAAATLSSQADGYANEKRDLQELLRELQPR